MSKASERDKRQTKDVIKKSKGVRTFNQRFPNSVKDPKYTITNFDGPIQACIQAAMIQEFSPQYQATEILAGPRLRRPRSFTILFEALPYLAKQLKACLIEYRSKSEFMV